MKGSMRYEKMFERSPGNDRKEVKRGAWSEECSAWRRGHSRGDNKYPHSTRKGSQRLKTLLGRGASSKRLCGRCPLKRMANLRPHKALPSDLPNDSRFKFRFTIQICKKTGKCFKIYNRCTHRVGLHHRCIWTSSATQPTKMVGKKNTNSVGQFGFAGAKYIAVVRNGLLDSCPASDTMVNRWMSATQSPSEDFNSKKSQW